MAGHRSEEGTVQADPDQRNWYVIAGYLAFGVMGALYVALVTVDLDAPGYGFSSAGFGAALLLFLLSIAAVATFGAILQDAAYVHDTRAPWNPQLRYYIGVPVVVPILLYAGLSVAVANAVAGKVALVAFPSLSWVSSAVFLYRRREYIGLP